MLIGPFSLSKLRLYNRILFLLSSFLIRRIPLYIKLEVVLFVGKVPPDPQFGRYSLKMTDPGLSNPGSIPIFQGYITRKLQGTKFPKAWLENFRAKYFSAIIWPTNVSKKLSAIKA